MPNRLLRDGIRTSSLIDALEPPEEVFFYRLLTVADDYGHCDGRIAILKAECFPLKDLSFTVIEGWLSGLVSKGLVHRYEVDGKRFIAIMKWDNRIRSNPKYPLPDEGNARWIDGASRAGDSDSPQLADSCARSADGCMQTADNTRTDDSNPPTDVRLGRGKGRGRGATTNVGRNSPTSCKTALPDDWTPSESSINWCLREFGLRVPEDVQRYVEGFRDACRSKGYKYLDFDAAFKNCVRQDWPKLRGVDGKIRDATGERKLAL